MLAALAGCAGSPSSSESLGAESLGGGQDSPAGVVNAAAQHLPESVSDPLHRSFSVGLSPNGDSLVSGIICDESTFNEALPSWSVTSDQPFSVEIRVRRPEPGAEGIWSPWLRIGDWGTPTRAEGTPTQFSNGKVAVDVLQLLVPHDAAQLSFTSVGGTLDPETVAASIVLSDTTGLDAALRAASEEAWPGNSLLKVAPRSQRAVGDDIGGRICSPTSVSMVAAYHGANIPTREMAESLLDPHYDIYGNWNRAVQGPAALGVPGRLVRVSSWASVAGYLDRGLPVVASIKAKEGELAGAPYKKTAGHLLVVTGLGPAGAVHVNDPAARLALDVPRVYQRADMERVWFANGGVGYVFGPKIPEQAQ